MRMEMEAVTTALRWVSVTTIAGAVVVSDSQTVGCDKSGWSVFQHHICKGFHRFIVLDMLGSMARNELASMAPIVGTFDLD